MTSILAGQARHILTGVGYLGAAEGATSDSLEVLIGSIVLALLGHLWSWLAKRRERAA
ncbi:hypothetical protein [Crenalkalicoccus roseus]|uniref:hypothetical protein n=1 Tax=Crenalkalicoccus roseus TaxID=1485588 RepID=UPI00130516AC|nr:hypothetical protein [Crenalkalicoccus roseus]